MQNTTAHRSLAAFGLGALVAFRLKLRFDIGLETVELALLVGAFLFGGVLRRTGVNGGLECFGHLPQCIIICNGLDTLQGIQDGLRQVGLCLEPIMHNGLDKHRVRAGLAHTFLYRRPKAFKLAPEVHRRAVEYGFKARLVVDIKHNVHATVHQGLFGVRHTAKALQGVVHAERHMGRLVQGRTGNGEVFRVGVFAQGGQVYHLAVGARAAIRDAHHHAETPVQGRCKGLYAFNGLHSAPPWGTAAIESLPKINSTIRSSVCPSVSDCACVRTDVAKASSGLE